MSHNVQAYLGPIYFRPPARGDFTTTLYLRNNLTRLERIDVHASGGVGEVRLRADPPAGGLHAFDEGGSGLFNRPSLDFDLNASHWDLTFDGGGGGSKRSKYSDDDAAAREATGGGSGKKKKKGDAKALRKGAGALVSSVAIGDPRARELEPVLHGAVRRGRLSIWQTQNVCVCFLFLPPCRSVGAMCQVDHPPLRRKQRSPHAGSLVMV